MSNEKQKVRVRTAVRTRPLSSKERSAGRRCILKTEKKQLSLELPARAGGSRNYLFDNVFSAIDQQAEVYEAIGRPAVDEVLRGFNSTVFAYGQTGSGKTHSIIGGEDPDSAGLLPRAVKALFSGIEGVDATLRVSALELYNEELIDLLADTTTSSNNISLRLYETQDGGVQVKDLREIFCDAEDDAAAAFKRAYKGRRVAATHCNQKSSRSHAVFQIRVVTRSTSDDGRELVTHGCLNVVDLAGSECVGKSGARDTRLREAGQINQSLLTLGRVITALTSSGNQHIPYRDSKLTRLLQDSLGGKTLTTILACVSPSSDAADETASTLQYASRAKAIYNTPEAHTRLQGTAVLKDISQELEDLRALLRAQRDKNDCISLPNEQYDTMVAEIEKSKDEIATLNSHLMQCQDQLDATRNELNAEQARHAATRACETALRQSETNLVQNGNTLSFSMSETICELESALALIKERAENMQADTRKAAAAALEASAASNTISAQIQSSILVSLDKYCVQTTSALETASNLALSAARELTHLGLACAEALKLKVKNDGLADIDRSENQAVAICSACDTAHTSAMNAGENIDGIMTKLNNTSKDIDTRLVSTQRAISKSMNESYNRTIKAKDDAELKHTKVQEEAATALKDNAIAIQARDEILDRERANFFALCDGQRDWLEEVQRQLRDTIDQHFETRMRTLENVKAEVHSNNTTDSVTLTEQDTSRLNHLTNLNENILPSTLADYKGKLDSLNQISTQEVTSAAASLPVINDDLTNLASECAAVSSSTLTELRSTAADVKNSGESLAASLRTLSIKHTNERNTFTKDLVANFEKDATATSDELHAALEQSTVVLENATSSARDSINETSDHIKSASATVSNTILDVSNTMASRDCGNPDGGVARYRETLTGLAFHSAPNREAIIADHYASSAAAMNATIVKKLSSATSVPLADASNR